MSVLEFIKVVILGIVEGITEWLPISSTGHMILVDEFIKMDMTKEFKDFFLVVIQPQKFLRSCMLQKRKVNQNLNFELKCMERFTNHRNCNILIHEK